MIAGSFSFYSHWSNLAVQPGESLAVFNPQEIVGAVQQTEHFRDTDLAAAAF